MRAPLTGTLTNVVSSTATTTDPVPANNNGSVPAAQVLTTIEPVDLAVTKTSLPEFRIGTVGTYTLTVRNVGNAPSVGTITVVDTLPASLRFSSADGPGWSCGASGADRHLHGGGSARGRCDRAPSSSTWTCCRRRFRR